MIILDLHLEDSDGIEILHHLNEINYPGHIILCSGLDSRLINASDAIARQLGLKMLPAIQKPIKIRELKNILENYWSCDPDISCESIHRGIDLNQFTIHYQPKMKISTLDVIGLEALIRWNYNDELLLYPDAFIPIAEHSHAIDTLTEWLIDQVLQDIQEWRKKGFDLSVAINIPANFLVNPNIPQILTSKIQTYGTPLSAITFEITETGVMALPNITKDIISRLRIRGVSFSIDDFGTGYSSLISLHNIPFNELKIDKIFIMNLHEDEDAQKIVNAAINLAHNLGMTVVAEGVENRQSLNVLRDLGCDIAQGYLIAKPMPKEELTAWLENQEYQAWKDL